MILTLPLLRLLSFKAQGGKGNLVIGARRDLDPKVVSLKKVTELLIMLGLRVVPSSNIFQVVFRLFVFSRCKRFKVRMSSHHILSLNR